MLQTTSKLQTKVNPNYKQNTTKTKPHTKTTEINNNYLADTIGSQRNCPIITHLATKHDHFSSRLKSSSRWRWGRLPDEQVRQYVAGIVGVLF